MKFYFDDSGSFSVTQSAPHVMLGVLIPDVKEKEFLNFYSTFIKTLEPEEFKDDEPKGSLLKDSSRKRLFQYLSSNPWIRIATSVSDSEFNNEKQIQGYRIEQVKLYEADFKNGLANKVPPDLAQLQSDLLEATKGGKGGISDVQFVKGLLLFSCVQALLQDSITTYEDAIYDSSWRKFDITFDRQDKNIITKMEKWINKEFMHFIQEHSVPFVVPDSWSIRQHPFMSSFRDGSNNRLVLNAIFKDRFQFEDSKSSPGLQYADWISNTVRQVVFRKRDPSYLDLLRPNLVGRGKARLLLVQIFQADMNAIHSKYKDLLY
jgi:hypothetical protein